MTDSPYVAKRVQAGIPLWDILVRGEFVGTLSDLPREDYPMATVRYGGIVDTFDGATIHIVLEKVGDHLASMDSALEAQADEAEAVYEMEYHAEVIAPMIAAEQNAERLGWGDDEPVW